MFKKILLGVALVIVIFAVVVALQPTDYQVTRAETISAAPAAVFAHVNDFHKWPAWSPWEKLDPDMTRTFGGEPAGVGAVYSWAGDSNVGKGSMTITESRPNELIRLKLEFIEPMAGTSDTDFTFEPKGEGTEVTWTMSGKNGFVAKAICLFMSMDKMIGERFEEGLADLKTVAETEAR